MIVLIAVIAVIVVMMIDVRTCCGSMVAMCVLRLMVLFFPGLAPNPPQFSSSANGMFGPSWSISGNLGKPY